MVKNFFIFAFATILIGTTGWLIYERQKSNAGKTAAFIGIAVGSPTPTPSPAVGDAAMQDPQNLIGNSRRGDY